MTCASLRLVFLSRDENIESRAHSSLSIGIFATWVKFLIIRCLGFQKATQIDNPDRYALATVVVSREGALGIEPTAGKKCFLKILEKNGKMTERA